MCQGHRLGDGIQTTITISTHSWTQEHAGDPKPVCSNYKKAPIIRVLGLSPTPKTLYPGAYNLPCCWHYKLMQYDHLGWSWVDLCPVPSFELSKVVIPHLECLIYIPYCIWACPSVHPDLAASKASFRGLREGLKKKRRKVWPLCILPSPPLVWPKFGEKLRRFLLVSITFGKQ